MSRTKRQRAMRDLTGARERTRSARRGTARRQLQQFLLRHGRRYDGKTAWTGEYMEVDSDYLKFDHDAHNRVLVDYLAAVETATARLDALTKAIVDVVETWSSVPAGEGAPGIARCPVANGGHSRRGDRKLCAIRERADAAWHISGWSRQAALEQETRRRRGIPDASCGNRGPYAPRSSSAAWNNRFEPRVSRELMKRHDGVAPKVCAIAWKAQLRLPRPVREAHKSRQERKEDHHRNGALETAEFV